MDTLPLDRTKTYKFYGVDNNSFKLGKQVFEAIEDPEDGYRSCLGSIEVKDPKGLIFFKTAVDTVKVVDAAEYSGFKLVSVKDGHVWLEVGTDYSDNYYPCFVFTYTPRHPKCDKCGQDVKP
jgi:hypothetical protein